LPAATPSPTILVFDSGLGGLTVFREVAAARPDARFLYLADDAAFPYGDLAEDKLIARVRDVLGAAIARHRPALVVVACNTASTLALTELRARFDVPFVGTVPAIKPACAQSQSKRIAVLGTLATVTREYTKALIREFAAGCEVTLVGSPRLAAYAEAEFAGEPVADAEITSEIAACFVDKDGRRTDTVVLACTHYPLLLARLRVLAPWPVTWLDPAVAIARRVADLLHERPATVTPPPPAPQIVFSSGRNPSPKLAAALAAYGFQTDQTGSAGRFDRAAPNS
jgi:glutamate racemase